MKRDATISEGYLKVRDCRHGRFLYNSNDAYVGRSLDRYGEFSEEELKLLLEFASGLVLDVGANIGALTVPLALRAREVIAFEPQRWVGDALSANIVLNSLTNVQVVKACLSSHAHTVFIPEIHPASAANFGGVGINTLPRGIDPTAVSRREVSAVSLDEIRGKLGEEKISLIKIDVEGHEQEVLLGMKETIARERPVLYVENDREENAPALLSLIRSYGYDLYEHRPYLYSSLNFFAETENIFPNIVSFNVLAIPHGRAWHSASEIHKLQKI